MTICSGHETTISLYEVFLMIALGFDKDFFIFPKFASQVTFEVTTKKNSPKKEKYSDYYVNYYFDDELLFKMIFPEFNEKNENHIWSTEQINENCDLNIMIIFLILSDILLALSISY